MSHKAAGASKANPTVSKSVKPWDPEENVKLLLLMMSEGNPQLLVKGWKNIGERNGRVTLCLLHGEHDTNNIMRSRVRRACRERDPVLEKGIQSM